MKNGDERAQRIFACLGDPSRYRVVATLKMGERCVTELAREIGLSQSCTTRHLQALQREGLVSGARSGKRVFFRLRTDEPIVAGLLKLAGGHDPYVETSHRDEEPSTESPTEELDSEPQPQPQPQPQPSGVRPNPERPRDIDDFLL